MNRPLLPSYFRINNIDVIQESPLLFNVTLGKSNFDAESIEIELTDYALYILSLADGSKPISDIKEEVATEFKTSGSDILKAISTFFEMKIIVDAETHPFAMPNKKERYARHMLFFESLGLDGQMTQEKISNSKVAIIGSGGIGTWLGYNLTAAGIAHLTLIDADRVEESNLTRQVLYTMEDVGEYKVDACKKRILERNPNVAVNAINKNVNSLEDLSNFIGNVDMIVLAGDSPANINQLVNEYAYKNNIPWTRSGYHYYTAICGPMYIPGKTSCFECSTEVNPRSFQTELPFISEINQRFQVPSFSPVNGISATIQAKEVLAHLAQIDHWTQTTAKMYACDLRTLEIDLIEMDTNKTCSLCEQKNK